MERSCPTGNSSEITTSINLFKRIISLAGKQYHSLNNGLDYWLTKTSISLKDSADLASPSLTEFIGDIEIATDRYQTTHQLSTFERLLDHGIGILINPTLVAEIESSCLKADLRRFERVNQWARDHGKDPL